MKNTNESLIGLINALEERIKGTQTKGERTQSNLALNYLCGAASLAEITGQKELMQRLVNFVFLISVRGITELWAIRQTLIEQEGEKALRELETMADGI